MKQGKKKMIPALAKADEACQQLLVHPEQKVRDLLIGRLAAKSWPTHLKRVGSLVSQHIANGGSLRVPIKYYACHTGRWGGVEKINLQNLGGRGRGIENDYLIQVVKQLIGVPDALGVADSAQIEARVLAWLAGQQDLLDGFAAGEDVYSVFATRLFGCEVRKPKDTDSPDLAVELKIKRGFGKDAILGAGYGMGATRFYNNCMANPDLRPLFDSGQYDFKFIKQLIDLYRSKYNKIPAYWTSVEKAFKRVIRFPHLEVEVGCVTFRNDHGTVEIVLPSSRVLYYRHCKVDRKNTIKWHHGTLWGGSITENIDQSISRDLLGYWILKCEDAGLSVVLHIHDDIKTLLPVDQAEEMLEKQMAIMKTTPDWAKGLPIDVEGHLSETL
jgi:DNA polymerase